MRSATKRNHKNKPKGYSGDKEHNDCTEKFHRQLHQQTLLSKRKNWVSMKTGQLKLPSQRKEKEKKKMKKKAKILEELQDTTKRNNIHINGSPRNTDKERKKTYLKK